VRAICSDVDKEDSTHGILGSNLTLKLSSYPTTTLAERPTTLMGDKLARWSAGMTSLEKAQGF